MDAPQLSRRQGKDDLKLYSAFIGHDLTMISAKPLSLPEKKSNRQDASTDSRAVLKIDAAICHNIYFVSAPKNKNKNKIMF